MAISRIEDTELVGKTISELSDRPTDPKFAGGDGLTSAQLKQRYDALPKLVKDRLNALIDALTGANDEDLLAQSLKVSEDQTLADFITAITAAVATKYALPEGGIPATDLAEAVTAAINGKYVKPDTGIPATDLADAVQTSLGKADTAYQKPSGGIPTDDLAEAIRTILTNAVSQSEFAPVKALAENADKVLTAANYEAVATMLNAAAKTDYKVGQKILIGAGRVPDLWIYFVHDAAVSYTYTTALAFQTALENGTLQIGYYALRPLEAKTDLEDYPTKTEMNSAISGNIDADLDTTGKAADAKAVGDAIDALIDGLVEGIITVAEAEYANAATYAQQAALATNADNLTPYSDESGTTQDSPFISQGTGTANNTASVDTSPIAKMLVKQGNTVVKNQLLQNGDFASTNNWSASNGSFSVSGGIATFTATASNGYFSQTSIPVVSGQKILVSVDIKLTTATDEVYVDVRENGKYTRSTTDWQTVSMVVSANPNSRGYIFFEVVDKRTSDWDAIQVRKARIFNLATHFNGNDNIPQDLLDNPDHWSWYENSNGAYDAGSLANANGRYLVCTGRQLWDEQSEAGNISYDDGSEVSSTTNIRSGFIRVIPNRAHYAYVGSGTGLRICAYDKSKNFLYAVSGTDSIANESFVVSAQTQYIRIGTVGYSSSTYKNDITISLYYPPEEGGEGYSKHYPYEEPKVYDTGTEQLLKAGSAVDDKGSNGTVTRRIGVVDLGTLDWAADAISDTSRRFRTTLPIKPTGDESKAGNALCTKYATTSNGAQWTGTVGIAVATLANRIFVYDPHYVTYSASEFKAAMSGVMLYYELATPTTEQGTTYPDYIDINDYGMMYWLDTDGNLVGIPQGIRLFYPVDYKAFVDTLHSRADGDAGNIALNGELASGDPDTLKGAIDLSNTIDGQLKEALGGTLRNLVAVANSLTFDDTDCLDFGNLSWAFEGTYGTATNVFSVYTARAKGASSANVAKALCSKYRVVSNDALYYGKDKCVAILDNGTEYYLIRINDTSYSDATAFKAAMKGVLLAYEKASS